MARTQEGMKNCIFDANYLRETFCTNILYSLHLVQRGKIYLKTLIIEKNL